MPVQNQFKPTPAIDLPFLNAWRDKMIERAVSLNIAMPIQRELIDFEQLFNDIKDASILEKDRLEQEEFEKEKLKKRITLLYKELESASWHDIAQKMKDLKLLISRSAGSIFNKKNSKLNIDY